MSVVYLPVLRYDYSQTIVVLLGFRWVQWLDQPINSVDKQSWALDDVYVGPACSDLCGGHGHCDYPVCICDHSYGGDNCHQTRNIKVCMNNILYQHDISHICISFFFAS